jgi:hypothetical protein
MAGDREPSDRLQEAFDAFEAERDRSEEAIGELQAALRTLRRAADRALELDDEEEAVRRLDELTEAARLLQEAPEALLQDTLERIRTGTLGRD